MKKFFNLTLLSAIALTGTSVFTGCSSSDDIILPVEQKKVADNPTYDPVGQTVTTQFVLNISAATNNNTRQTATTVQRNANFRGMKDAKLIGLATNSSYLAPYAGGTTTTDWNATSGIKSKMYDLGTLYGANAVSNTGTDNADNSSHRVVELTLPLTTDAMLVYGRAIPSGTDEENGKVVYNVTTAPENTTFDLVSRLGDNNAKYVQTCNLAALVLNRIMLSEIAERTYSVGNEYKTTVSGTDGYKQTENLAALSWRELGAATTTLAPLQENLAMLYKAITGFTTFGGTAPSNSDAVVRSGSASAILDMVKDTYKTVKSVYYATPTNDLELNAQRLAYEIMTRIEYYFTLNEGVVNAFRTIGTPSTEGSIAYALVHNNIISTDTYNTNYGDVTNALFTTFPTSFNLPAGVSQLYFTAYSATTGAATGGFTYTNPSQSLLEISQTLDPTKYMYPSELLYFDNSLLRVNDAEKAAADYPNGYNVWDTESNWSGWTTGKVGSTTRSVAVKNNINYGVAMLQTAVVLKEGVTAFKDNRSAIVTTESDQTLSAAQVSGFTLTGVLIGGQYKKLGWNYIAKSGATSNDNYVIYDNHIANNGAIPTTTTKENYTLVFDNYNAGGDQGDVLVALEFENGNEKDFYGKGGIVTKGSKFYLVGKLDLDAASNYSTFAWPTTYAIPPYTSGATTETKRVFVQDYMTVATFTIDEESLKNAYNTVPDLRATQTSLGLSVDLNWREGLNFQSTF